MALPAEWSAKARCIPEIDFEVKQIVANLKKVHDLMRKKTLKNASSAQDSGERVVRWIGERQLERICKEADEIIWYNKLEPWFRSRQMAVKEAAIWALNDKLKDLVVTRVDRMPGEGLIF